MEAKILNKPKFNINVTICNNKVYEEKKFPFTKYVVYTMKVKTNKKSWEVKRRYKNFYDLHQKLKTKKISILPKLTPKKMFLSEDDRKERQEKLEKYINELLSREDVYKHNEIFEFIEMEKEYFLMLHNNLQEISTGENSPTSGDKFKSFVNLKKSKSSAALINENFFYSNNFIKYEDENEIENILEPSMKNIIFNFLEDLNNRIPDKCKIIKEFEEKLNKKKKQQPIQRDEVFRLFYGEKVDDNFMNGLFYHCGNIQENQIGAEYCLEFISKLIDYQHTIECDFFVSILKLAKLPTIKQMSITKHLKSNKKQVVLSCYIIIKNLINEEKGIYISNIISDSSLTKNFEEWLIMC